MTVRVRIGSVVTAVAAGTRPLANEVRAIAVFGRGTGRGRTLMGGLTAHIDALDDGHGVRAR